MRRTAGKVSPGGDARRRWWGSGAQAGLERVDGAIALVAGALPSWPQLRSDRASRSLFPTPVAGLLTAYLSNQARARCFRLVPVRTSLERIIPFVALQMKHCIVRVSRGRSRRGARNIGRRCHRGRRRDAAKYRRSLCLE